jgi:hypothetical protein
VVLEGFDGSKLPGYGKGEKALHGKPSDNVVMDSKLIPLTEFFQRRETCDFISSLNLY